MVHCAELEHMWMQSQYILKHCHHRGRSQWLRRGSAAARWLGLRVRIPPGSWMSVSCECCVSCQVEVSASGWSLVQRRPTECDVSEFDSETLKISRPRPTKCCEIGGKNHHRDLRVEKWIRMYTHPPPEQEKTVVSSQVRLLKEYLLLLATRMVPLKEILNKCFSFVLSYLCCRPVPAGYIVGALYHKL